MDESSSGLEPSLLLLVVGIGVAMLAAQVMLGWVRQAQRRSGPAQQGVPLLLGAAAMGTGVVSAGLLSLQAAGLPFSVELPALAALGLWLGAIAVCLPLVFVLALRRQSWWVQAVAGALFAAVAVGVQWAWVTAADFRPGLLWPPSWVAAALLTMAAGSAAAFWVADRAGHPDVRRRGLWRAGATLLLGLALLAGQQLLMLGGGLLLQQSANASGVPGQALGLVCGALVPLALGMMSLDLALRSGGRRRRGRPGVAGPDVQLQKRRKRRYRARRL